MKRLNEIWLRFTSPANRKTVLLIASGLMIATGWLSGSLLNEPLLFDLMMIGAALIAGYDIVQRAWQGLKNRQTNIELLVSIAAIGGLSIGVYWESAAVTFLFLLGGWLEARSLNKTRSTLKDLLNMMPETATLLVGNTRSEILARNVEKDMRVLVKPGGKIPVDGLVEEGSSSVDESSITGEPVPALKQKGSEVYAGTINQTGRMIVRASRSGADTTLAKIIRRVEEAQEEKAPTQRFIERFASWYTPGIVVLSVITLAITQNIELALTLLVIGCPGALVISTPISIISGIGRAAKSGILIKGGEYLENAGKISAVAFDKTGTLTEGKPRVTDMIIMEPETVPAGMEVEQEPSWQQTKIEGNLLTDQQHDLLYWAAIAELNSEHPLAQAIINHVSGGEIPEPDYFESHTGFGVEAGYNSDQILVGNPDFIQAKNIHIPKQVEIMLDELSDSGRTVVLVALNNNLKGAIGISDKIRPEAAAMVEKLRSNGVQEIMMLTGDALITANSIAKEAGIRKVHSRMLPDDKLDAIHQLKESGHRVAMVGDGINDAPALARADIGIAMGAAGTDLAIETADIALMSDDLMKIPEALNISKLTLKNIRQNVVFALVTVAALLTGVFMGSVHMAGGMLIHELSVMAVILNGLRLRYI
ncbi:MAG: heavy metal translocating P-type ATPase [Cyclonatronaceae bacterium]